MGGAESLSFPQKLRALRAYDIWQNWEERDGEEVREKMIDCPFTEQHIRDVCCEPICETKALLVAENVLLVISQIDCALSFKNVQI